MICKYEGIIEAKRQTREEARSDRIISKCGNGVTVMLQLRRITSAYCNITSRTSDVRVKLFYNKRFMKRVIVAWPSAKLFSFTSTLRAEIAHLLAPPSEATWLGRY